MQTAKGAHSSLWLGMRAELPKHHPMLFPAPRRGRFLLFQPFLLACTSAPQTDDCISAAGLCRTRTQLPAYSPLHLLAPSTPRASWPPSGRMGRYTSVLTVPITVKSLPTGDRFAQSLIRAVLPPSVHSHVGRLPLPRV